MKAPRSAEAVLRELVKAQDRLLIAYRLNTGHGVGAIIDRITRCREELAQIDASPPQREGG